MWVCVFILLEFWGAGDSIIFSCFFHPFFLLKELAGHLVLQDPKLSSLRKRQRKLKKSLEERSSSLGGRWVREGSHERAARGEKADRRGLGFSPSSSAGEVFLFLREQGLSLESGFLSPGGDRGDLSVAPLLLCFVCSRTPNCGKSPALEVHVQLTTSSGQR